jgi:hypothetical protein
MVRENTIQLRTFKAKIRGCKPHFMQKVAISRQKIDDAFNRHFHSFISVFVPKLTPHYTVPHVMLHITNGGGSCMVRFQSPEKVIEELEKVIATLRSDKWMDNWFRINDIAQELVENNKLSMDENFIDINAWHKDLSNQMDVELVATKKEES